jgi:hypothetical protein
MFAGSLKLAQFPHSVVELTCKKCGRRGRLRKSGLIAKFGPDIALPDLRKELAQCERIGSISDPCGIQYVALKPTK